jgi:hypothetical protein
VATLVPVNSGWLDSPLAVGQGVKAPDAPPADQLSNVMQESYSLNISLALTLGFTVATIAPTASADVQHAMFLFGTTRYKDVVGDNGHVYRFGVAIRALIQVNAKKLDFALTLPFVAAKVQLSEADASTQLIVQGYKGELPSALPSWQDFDVESYGQYMKEVSTLRDAILADAKNIVPELLATSAGVQPPIPSTPVALGTLYALTRIAEGDGLYDALREFRIHDEQALKTVEAVYSRMLPGNDNGPSADVKRAAEQELTNYHLEREHRLPILHGRV